MAINILYQPEAAAVGMASYRAGQGEFAKEKARFEQQEREMQQRERMQAKQQAMQERQAALSRDADAQRQNQQLGFQAQAQQFAQQGREKLFGMEQKAQQDMFDQRQQAEMDQLAARAKADKEALEWKTKAELDRDAADIAAQEKAIQANPYLDDKQKGALIGALGVKHKDIRDAMLTKPEDPLPIAHLPETDQPGMPVVDKDGRTVGFRDRYGVPQPFTPPKSPKDPPSRDEFAKRYSEATKALTDPDGNAPDPKRVMDHLRQQDELYNQMYGGEQQPAPAQPQEQPPPPPGSPEAAFAAAASGQPMPPPAVPQQPPAQAPMPAQAGAPPMQAPPQAAPPMQAPAPSAPPVDDPSFYRNPPTPVSEDPASVRSPSVPQNEDPGFSREQPQAQSPAGPPPAMAPQAGAQQPAPSNYFGPAKGERGYSAIGEAIANGAVKGADVVAGLMNPANMEGFVNGVNDLAKIAEQAGNNEVADAAQHMQMVRDKMKAGKTVSPQEVEKFRFSALRLYDAQKTNDWLVEKHRHTDTIKKLSKSVDDNTATPEQRAQFTQAQIGLANYNERQKTMAAASKSAVRQDLYKAGVSVADYAAMPTLQRLEMLKRFRSNRGA